MYPYIDIPLTYMCPDLRGVCCEVRGEREGGCGEQTYIRPVRVHTLFETETDYPVGLIPPILRCSHFVCAIFMHEYYPIRSLYIWIIILLRVSMVPGDPLKKVNIPEIKSLNHSITKANFDSTPNFVQV